MLNIYQNNDLLGTVLYRYPNDGCVISKIIRYYITSKYVKDDNPDVIPEENIRNANHSYVV